jgi:hypothetical protein
MGRSHLRSIVLVSAEVAHALCITKRNRSTFTSILSLKISIAISQRLMSL